MISRVFQKTSGGKKVHISGLVRMNNSADFGASSLPPLMDAPAVAEPEPEPDHVHCFSNTSTNFAAPQRDLTMMTFFNNNPNYLTPSSNPNYVASSAFPWGQGSGSQFPGPGSLQDPNVIRSFLANYNMRKEREMVSVSQETGVSTENSSALSNLEMGKKAFGEEEADPIGPQDLDCIWSY